MKLKNLMPHSIETQMMAVLAGSFTLLLAVMAGFEFLEYDSVTEWARGEPTLNRLGRIVPIVETIGDDKITGFLAQSSHCHEGYSLSQAPYPFDRVTEETQNIAARIENSLSMAPASVKAGFSALNKSDFAYGECNPSAMNFPVYGIVISLQLSSGAWLNAEVHPHEWHITSAMTGWLLRSGAAFLIVGAAALIFVRRLSKPINALTHGAQNFGAGLEVTLIDEMGPPDVKHAIRSFNAMQRQVSDEVQRRTGVLAAISHDVRSPLTALRLKAELIEDEDTRRDLIASVDKMERITASALAFLKGESRNEPKRQVDLGALVDSECADFREMGAAVSFDCPKTIQYECRPDALARAINNLIENAIKYAGCADVTVRESGDSIEIVVTDCGPGIAPEKLDDVLKPFERLSDARESDIGGFGLGLAIAKAVTEGHDGVFGLAANAPRGLIATIKLPL